MTFKGAVCAVTIVLSILNMLQAFHIIMTGGVGKNGSTVAVSDNYFESIHIKNKRYNLSM